MKSKSMKRWLLSLLGLLMFAPFLMAQAPVAVMGQVTDEHNEPMIGVTVLRKEQPMV